MMDEVLVSAAAHDMETSVYEQSDLEVTEFLWENPQVYLEAVHSPGKVTPFSPTAFNDLEMGEGGSSENPLKSDEEEDREISPATTPVSERPTEPPKLLRSHPLGGRIEKLPEIVYRTLFE